MKFIVPLLFVIVLLPACSEKPHELIEKCADQRTKLLMPESLK